mmetsp:Transcript_41612/g.128553  ORF Transcript_41612/g.128553 Transcript_41612/m.128553 type:complete len:273 (-) Transcript_41612:447-1265(-)
MRSPSVRFFFSSFACLKLVAAASSAAAGAGVAAPPPSLAAAAAAAAAAASRFAAASASKRACFCSRYGSGGAAVMRTRRPMKMEPSASRPRRAPSLVLKLTKAMPLGCLVSFVSGRCTSATSPTTDETKFFTSAADAAYGMLATRTRRLSKAICSCSDSFLVFFFDAGVASSASAEASLTYSPAWTAALTTASCCSASLATSFAFVPEVSAARKSSSATSPSCCCLSSASSSVSSAGAAAPAPPLPDAWVCSAAVGTRSSLAHPGPSLAVAR